jgi:PAS domain S-box-containing protein
MSRFEEAAESAAESASRESEAQLAEARRELQRAVDTIPAPVEVFQPDGTLSFVNRTWRNYTALTLQQATGDGKPYFHPDDLERAEKAWRASLASGEPFLMELRVRGGDGGYRWHAVRRVPLRGENGDIAKWYGAAFDIEEQKTAAKAAEEARRARELSLRLIVDSIPAPAAVMTTAGQVEVVNRPVLEYFGKTFEDLKGWATTDAVHPDDLPGVVAVWREAVETGHPYEVESRHRRADGVYRWFHVRGFPLRDADGSIIRWCVLQTDVDDRKRTEALLAGEKQLLEMVARGCSLPVVLAALCRLVENTASGCYCSVLLIDSGNARFRLGAAPSLPSSYKEALDGQPVDCDEGPCGMAASLKTQVIASDVASERRWHASGWRGPALAHGLQAYWSTPILSGDQEALGTFAIYQHEPGSPTPLHQDLIGRLTHIASIAIERAQGEAALKRSETRKAAMLDSALDCIVTIDHEGRITEFNPAAERTFGFRRDQILGRHLADVIIPPSLREQHRRGLARYLATGEARVLGRRLELTALRADGSEIPVEIAVTRITSEGPPSFTGYLRDITERRLTEGRWKRMFENSAIGVAVANLDGRFEMTNSAYQILSGYTQEELLRMSFIDITVPEFQAHNLALVRELLEGKRDQFDIEKQYRRKDGHLVWVRNNVSLVPGADGAPRHIMAIVEDITDRKQTEEKLRRSEAFLAEGQHLSRVGSFSWRVVTDEIVWSEQLYRIFEFDQDVPVTLELIGTRVHPEDIPLLNDMIERARGGGEDFEYEHRLLMPDKSVKYLHLIGHSTRDKDGRLEYIGAAQDVTQRRLSEEALGKARSELAHVARVTSLGVLTASIAHEVNQPLAAIITNGETGLRWLARPQPDVERARELTKHVVADARRASEIIGRIRAMVTRRIPEPTLLSLGDIVAESMVFLRHEFQSQSVSVSLDLAPELPRVVGDRTQLQQVVVNLAINAVQAMAQSEAVRRSICIRTMLSQPEAVCCIVEDSGPGIDPTHLPCLFDGFFTTKDTGMGMGLPISRSIVEAHDGRIRADNDSALGGARFSFSLPANAVSAG